MNQNKAERRFVKAKYYQENKERLDANHAEYMKQHPEAREKHNKLKRDRTAFWNKFHPSKNLDKQTAIANYEKLWDDNERT